jgi:signal transduction histidine kinase/ligand-binding sensor domain-containing protein/ActR/RegA family two-component response regulator
MKINIKNQTIYLSFIFLLLSYSFLLNGQEQKLKFDHYSTREGLSQNSVITIYQDDENFMWFGTYGGINRFDGYNFIRFQYSQSNPLSISENHVRSICQESTGILLVATTAGLNRFFTHEKVFIHYLNNPKDATSLANNTVYKVLKDKDGDIWVGTWGGGLDKMELIKDNNSDPHKARYNFIHHKPGKSESNISSLWIIDIAESYDGSLWIATNNGLSHFNKKTQVFTNYFHNPDNKNSLSSNDVSSVCIDKWGNIWIGNWGGGVDVFNPRINKFVHFKNKPGEINSLSHNTVMKLFCDYSGNIWVGTWGGGLNRVVIPDNFNMEFSANKIENKITFLHYKHNENDLLSICGNSIYSIFEDETGIMWVGTDWGGLSKFEKKSPKFRHVYSEPGSQNTLINNIVFSLHVDRNNQLWIGTQEGLNIYHPKTDSFELFVNKPFDPGSISHNHVRSITEDSDGTIWLGTINGLNKYNPKTRSFKRYYIDFERQSSNNILHVLAPAKDVVWICTYEEGLLRFNPKTEKFKKYMQDPANPRSISNNIVWSIVEDKNKKLWVGTLNGLCYFNPETEEFIKFFHEANDTNSLSDNYVLSLCIDHNENIWIGTAVGLNKLTHDKNGKTVFIRYYEKDGLAAQTINGIIEDFNNQLWITTSKGISRMNPSTGKFTNYSLIDGLQDPEFSINAIIKNANSGEIYAGGVKGFNIFHPAKIMGNNIPPVAKIVGLKLFNKSVGVNEEINGKIILKKYISSLDYLELSHKEYVMSFEFAALHYQSPDGNQFAFKLEGFDKEWNFVGNQRIATYTNLPHGKYTFLVKAANSDGVWNEVPASLKLFIKPPWWNTLLFKVLASLTIISILFFIFRFRMRITKQRQKHLEEMVQKRTEELSDANVLLEEKQEEISLQNEELLNHRNNLENIVEERTAELTTAKIKAEESEKLKSSFLANMSHEVRTPMNAIIGFSNLLEDENLEKGEKEYFLNMIKNNGNTLLTLIDDILDISIIEANQLVLYKESFSINDILKEIYSYYQLGNVKDIKIELLLHNTNDMLLIYNDPIRFRQVMNNLVGNAVKYTETGFIKFGYSVESDFIRVFVEDTGIGINKDDQASIFDYFYKIETNETKLYQGTGIGLTICKKLVESMGGIIGVNSEPGRGSIFYFTIPNISKQNSDATQVKSYAKNMDLHDLVVVVAEDEPNNFHLIEKILRKTSSTLLWAKNGKEAVDLAKNMEKDKRYLFLMDIKMPVMNGIEANRLIKMINKEIPVIAITAYAQTADRTKIMNENFDDYMSKPINSNKLLDIISIYSSKKL